MTAASLSEIAACMVRVPTEVVKQRYQANIMSKNLSLITNIASLLKAEGISGLYTGFGSTIMREIPFSLIQFPLYEWMKVSVCSSNTYAQ